jgi:GAF domain-containing protein
MRGGQNGIGGKLVVSNSGSEPGSRPKSQRAEGLEWFWTGFASTFVSAALVLVGSTTLTLGLRFAQDLFWVWVIIAFLLAGLGWLVGFKAKAYEAGAKRRVQEKLDAAKREADEGHGHLLSGLVYTIDQLFTSAAPGRDSQTYLTSVLTQSVNFFGAKKVRVCLYDVEKNEGEANEKLPDVLVLHPPHRGRNDLPRKAFDRNSDHGRWLFKVLEGRRARRIVNVDDTHEPIDSKNRAYKTFVAAPVLSETEELGVFLVDATEAGVLTEADEVLAQAIADLLAVGMKRLRIGDVAKTVVPPLENAINKGNA